MRAAVTSRARSMALTEIGPPRTPGPGEAIVRPQVVGICGSDFHLFLGELGPLFPRIQGHEACAVVEEVGPGSGHLSPGDRVALWPILGCGTCYPCSIGRGNACSAIRILGIHFDGALQERLLLPAAQLVPVGALDPALAALVEPVSIAVRAVTRARIVAGEQVAVLGAGPIGQCIALAALDRGASVLVVDRIPSRLALARKLGADATEAGEGNTLAPTLREWSGAEGPPVVVDATGAASLIEAGVEAVATAGRVVVVGISEEAFAVAVGSIVFRELDLIGVSCCSSSDFSAAAELVARRPDDVQALITHEFPFDSAPQALEYAMENPAEVMKTVIRLEA